MSDGPRILIVDDEPNIRDLLITSLRFAGFAVRAVGNGAQTISAVLEEEPDLIILDVMLPDMNGFGVTKRLRGAGLHRARSCSSPRRTTPRTRSPASPSAATTTSPSRSASTRSSRASRRSCAARCRPTRSR